MSSTNRQQQILEHLEAAGACSYQELARLLGVSGMTARRDVDKLAKEDGVIKTLGGVQAAGAPKHFYESAMRQRLTLNAKAKNAIARAAADLIEPPQTIFLDGSTTCLALARVLAHRSERLTIVTHSAPVCMQLGRNHDDTVISLGGQYEPNSACTVGPSTEAMAKCFFVDLAFVSTKGFSPEEGTFESAVAVYRIKQIVSSQAAMVVLLVDHSKFDQRALCKVLDLSQITTVVTDAKTTDQHITALKRKGVDVLRAPAAPEPSKVQNHAT